MTNNDIVQKLWNLCDVLRDDGINYSDYVTELVLLLFIKMVHENTEAGTLKKHPLPEGCRWTDLNGKSGINLLNDYKRILLSLSTGKDGEGRLVHDDPLISAIYADAQTRLREPRHLEQMIKTLDQIDWFSAQKDGLGDLYEGLLEKNANETKSGAGQYFTPPRFDQHNGALPEAPARGDHSGPVRRHRRLSDCRPRIHQRPDRRPV